MRKIIEKIKITTSALIDRFNKLGKRRKILVLLLTAALLFSLLFNVVYKPQRSALRKLQEKSVYLKNRAAKIKAKFPDTAEEKRSLAGARRSLENLRAQIVSMETELPLASSLPYLLGELIRQASGYAIDFTSIKQIVVTEKKSEYTRLNIEMEFNAGYSDFVNYLHRLENSSKFLTTTEIAMEEMKDGFKANSKFSIVLSTLLGEGTGDEIKISQGPKGAPFIEPIDIKRDPFISKFMPRRDKKKEKEYKLSGIISRGEKSTAIINGKVYRVGDFIGEEKVEQILPNMVMLANGREITALTLEKD